MFKIRQAVFCQYSVTLKMSYSISITASKSLEHNIWVIDIGTTFHKLLGKMPLCSLICCSFLFMRVPLNICAHPHFLNASGVPALSKSMFYGPIPSSYTVICVSRKQAPKLLMLKLNMVDLKANFRGKNENAFCRRCGVHEEYVEHLWECSLFENKNLPNFTNMTKNNPKVLSIIQKYVEKFINKRS